MSSFIINFNWPTVNNISPVYNFKIKNWIMYYLLTNNMPDFVLPVFFCLNLVTKSQITQGTHEVMITSLLRWNDVATLFWRNAGVIIKSCVHWDTCIPFVVDMGSHDHQQILP